MSHQTMRAATRRQNSLRGDEAALFTIHHERLLRWTARDVPASPQCIEDACAFAFAELVARQPERSQIAGWLRVVARREAIRLATRERRSLSLDVAPARGRRAGVAALVDTLPAREERLGRRARAGLALVAALPERKRRIFARHIAGLSYDEIAAEQQITVRTVERQIRRARARVGDADREGA